MAIKKRQHPIKLVIKIDLIFKNFIINKNIPKRKPIIEPNDNDIRTHRVKRKN
tara:strand:+ start:89 stop:247 length:159 start_codon:yes stop_codon:yes gene_type:complete